MTQSDASTSDQELRDLIADWSRAVEAKDADAIVAAYTPETVLFDAIPPAKTVGGSEIADIWRSCFPFFPDRFRSEHKDLKIEVDGDVAFVHGLHHFTPEDQADPVGQTWMRVTVGLRRIGGAWRVMHEHVSVPFDPTSGKAVYLDGDAQPVASQPCAPGDASADIPPKPPGVMPHLVIREALRAFDVYARAFGAKELVRLLAPDGRLMHGCVEINGSPVMLVDEFPDAGCDANSSPQSLNASTVTLHMTVPDADATVARAVEAGFEVIVPLADMFWGDRYGVIRDPFGHQWSIATSKRAVPVSDLQAAADAAMAAGTQ